MRRIIITFSGFKQSGKTTSVELMNELISENFNFGSQIGSITTESFADPIKRIIEDIFGVTEDTVENKETPLKITKKFFRKPKSYRELCIAIGDNMKTSLKCNNLWCNTIERHILNKFSEENPLDIVYIIPDVRYASELKMLQRMRKRGYEVYHICVFRKESIPDWANYGLDVRDETCRNIIVEDFSPERSEWEWCVANPTFNFILKNDGTKKELKEQIFNNVVKKIWTE